MGGSSSKFPGLLDSLRLSPAQQKELLDRLRREAGQPKHNRRTEVRQEYEPAGGIVIQVSHPGGTNVQYLVYPRDLSKRGMAFLHGSYIHTGTPCLITLRTCDQQVTMVQAQVRRCRHVTGHIHEVGVRFSHVIRLEHFIERLHDALDADMSIELPPVTRHMLYVEDSPADQELLQYQLSRLGVQVTAIASAMDAVLWLADRPIDAVITALWLPGMTGPEMALTLREQGFAKPIVGLTSDTNPQTHALAREWGCQDVLLKPYPFAALLACLRQHAGFQPPGDALARLLPAGQDQCILPRPLILSYLRRVDQHLRDLRKQIPSHGSPAWMRKICIDLTASAGTYQLSALHGHLDHFTHLMQEDAPVPALLAYMEAIDQEIHQSLTAHGHLPHAA